MEQVITYAKHSHCGMYLCFGHTDIKDTVVIRKDLETPALRKLTKVGKPYAPAAELAAQIKANSAAVLARGLDKKSAPNTVDAMRMNKAQERKAEKAAAESVAPAKVKAVKAEQRKAERAEKAAPKADDTRAITLLVKDYVFGKEGTARRKSWDICVKSNTVAAYIKAGGAAKYLPRWVASKVIKLG
jgi:hypothetical protein